MDNNSSTYQKNMKFFTPIFVLHISKFMPGAMMSLKDVLLALCTLEKF